MIGSRGRDNTRQDSYHALERPFTPFIDEQYTPKKKKENRERERGPKPLTSPEEAQEKIVLPPGGRMLEVRGKRDWKRAHAPN